jgi:glutamate---cysteine ligase / carboxylate-amine ligase
MSDRRLARLMPPASFAAGGPRWARWQPGPGRAYTIGVEEELMLLDPGDRSLAPCSDQVLPRLSAELAGHAAPETHAAVMELRTGIHMEVGAAAAELSALRTRLARELQPMGVVAGCAGLHPLAGTETTAVSGGARYRGLEESLRFLARREPTLALHVHVGIPDPQDAVRLQNRLREYAALLLAVSANSPFLHGLDSGFASARTAIFGGFPRTGTPRAFASYADYVEAIDVLIASGAIPDATHLWWDVRLQPALGTVEVRVMDAQSTVADSAPLIALIQSLARLELEGTPASGWSSPEVLAENRFLAARDGADARLIDPVTRRLVPVRTLLAEVVRECLPHAAALGCSDELEALVPLADANGATRQRAWVAGGGDLRTVVSPLDPEGSRRPLTGSAAG